MSALADQKRLAAEALLSALPVPMEEAAWAHEVRAKARARLLDQGAPVRRDEYWKYTNPAKLSSPLALAEPSDEQPAAAEAFGGQPHARFVNGRLRQDLSAMPHVEGLAVSSFAEVVKQDISIAREVFGVLEHAGQEKVMRPLAILNTATATDGLVIQAHGAAGQVHMRSDLIGDGASVLRHLIRVEAGAELTLLESGSASNTVIEVDVAEGGIFHHIRVQSGARTPSASHIFARLHTESQFKTFTLSADGEITRNEVVLDLVGEEASGHIAGAVLAQDQSHVDNTVFVTHSAAHCESRQVFKSVLAGRAKSVFQGKIFVRDGAQKTDGYQISQSVLLNDGAEFLAKPELEIYADDVACSHGSTTGALDPTAMFYLRSRGVRKADAEAMLIAAFADEAIAEIADEDLADTMRAEVARWMSNRS
ncbi:MAG: SufD family Fe-S cluster assembly protein [Pseudomonadota bacterium]